jgi:predicted branched-subunit amino acid permease
MRRPPILPEFWQGLRAGAPFILVIVPFGAVFGVVATEAGLNVAEVLGFSVLVIAGAAQFVALQMMNDNAPTLIVLAAALVVNLRMAMYSAALAPHLGGLVWWRRGIVAYWTLDQTFASSTLKYDTTPGMTLAQKYAFFMGAGFAVCPPWYVATWAGAEIGRVVPADLPIDFAVPITFLALIVPMLRTPAHIAAALVSIAGALVFGFLPYNTGLLLAALLAMVTGAEVERRMAKGRA